MLFVWLVIALIAATAAQDNIINEKPCNGGAGECVPQYLCDNGKFKTDGSDLIDIRFSANNECGNYFELCCDIGSVGESTTVNLTLPPPTSCGFRNANGVMMRITGSENNESEFAEFPWMVAVLKSQEESSNKLYVCGGSLIHPSVVLTAAHCLSNRNPSIYIVRAGEWDTHTQNEPFKHSDHEVADLAVHPEYYRGGLYNDAALVFLKNEVEFGPHTGTICLPPQNQNFDRQRCFVSGWGKNKWGDEGAYQAILKRIEVPVVPHEDCQTTLRWKQKRDKYQLHESFICAGGEPDKDSCDGDGGSPLVCEIEGSNGHFYQAGIVAWGVECGVQGVPGIYANVAKFRSWIDETMDIKRLVSDYYSYV